MAGLIYRRLSRWARPRTWVACAVTAIACLFLFDRRRTHLGVEVLLDAERWYTPARVVALFDVLGPDGRRLYAISEVTLDLVFPIAYGLLLATVLVRLVGWSGPLWSLLPIGAALADVLENITIATLAVSYRGTESALMWVAAVFTAVKSALLLATFVALVVGLAVTGWRAVFRGPRPNRATTSRREEI
ncbi:MAG: hypothetical protein MJB57_00900 [Gemmatimonadetes bacterium]|nr:hypothetical protein [Gemmatimonadota bacterium]